MATDPTNVVPEMVGRAKTAWGKALVVAAVLVGGWVAAIQPTPMKPQDCLRRSDPTDLFSSCLQLAPAIPDYAIWFGRIGGGFVLGAFVGWVAYEIIKWLTKPVASPP